MRGRKGAAAARRPGTLTPLDKVLHHGATIVVGLSGLAFAWMKYLLPPPADDPFAIVSHPWQPSMLHLHVLAAPLWLLALGLMLRDHVVGRIRNPARRRGRWSGIASASLLAPMIASGYLLQTATGEGWRGALVVLHVGSGLAYLVTYAAHVVIGRLTARRRELEGHQPLSHPLEAGGLHLRVGGAGNRGGGESTAIP